MYDSPIHKTARAPKTGPASFAFSEPLLRRHRILCGLLAAVQLLIPSLTLALPTDGRVAGGGATLQSTSKSITIQQTTDKAILNWKSFSIAADEAVHFRQPSADSIALNRVIGGDPSVIFGRLQANGRIFLLNPNGILFGAGAQLNVGGLLASTLHTRDEEFMAGRYLFAQDPLKGLKTVVNQGTLQVSEHGFVILAAPAVSNEGIIVANLGTTVLGSGQKLTVDLLGDGLINYALTGKVLEQVTGIDGTASGSAVKNSGTIHADGGQVILQASAAGDIFSSVVNQSGVIRARSLTHEDGIVRLDGGTAGRSQWREPSTPPGLPPAEQADGCPCSANRSR
jgi:filamentous hemagglutinin family protein